MSKDLLFEIGVEEIPAGFIPRALEALSNNLRKKLEANRLEFSAIRTLGTPRRLVLIAEGLCEGQPDADIEVRGPQAKAAYDENGNPTKMLEGFAKAQGVKIKELKTVKTDKGEYVFARRNIKGKKTTEILPALLTELMSQEMFAKSMRWASYDVSFARPVHWILAVYGAKLVTLEWGHVKSANLTYGHRFLGALKGARPAAIKVAGVDSYLAGLKEGFVVPDPGQRKEIIRKGLLSEANSVSGEVLPDEGLLEEVTYLVEYPMVLRGSFDTGFLGLPRDVVVNAMREHQRYFCITDKKGVLLPHFLTVANTKAKDAKVVIKGNERVLRARLNDAKFYFEKDIKTPLVKRAEALKGVIFQSKLGTSYEKVERFTELALFIGARTGFSRPLEGGEKAADFLTDSMNPASYDPAKIDSGLYSKYVLGRGAMLAKADLTSGVVGEFPKLQGIMGSVYARRSGEVEEVAASIYEHYLPVASAGALPASVAGAIVSIADKLDTICGCFGVGLIPTGAQDPYALRRQALGIIAIMTEKDFTVGIDELVGKGLELIGDKLTREMAEVKNDVLEFFKERLRNQLLTQKLPFDSIDAVLSSPWYDIPEAVKRAYAIEDFKGNPACADLAMAFKRVSNILKGQGAGGAAPRQKLFSDPNEAALFEVVSRVAPVIKGHTGRGDYKKALEELAAIKDRIDAFFDKVLVMAEDSDVRKNRLALLNSVRDLYYSIADISKLAV